MIEIEHDYKIVKRVFLSDCEDSWLVEPLFILSVYYANNYTLWKNEKFFLNLQKCAKTENEKHLFDKLSQIYKVISNEEFLGDEFNKKVNPLFKK